MKGYLVKLCVFLVLLAGLCFIPLVGAYDYESALCVALLGLVALPALAQSEPGTGWRGLAMTLAGAVLYWILANGVSIGIAALRGELCDIVKGVEWQLLLSLPSVLLTALVWGWISRVFQKRVLRVLTYILALGLDFGFAGYALFHWPSLVAFGQFFGYFAGSIYDEAIDVFPSLAMWRCGTLVLCLCLWFAQTPGAGTVRRILGPAVGLVAAFGIHWGLSASGRLVYMGRGALREALWATASPDDGAFTVHYVPKSKNRASMAAERHRILAEYGRDFHDLEAFFAARPRAPIDIWLYPDVETKGRFMGARHTSFARVWENEVHLVAGSPGATLARHEMAHLFAGSFADGPLYLAGGLIPSPGWFEGLAMAAEWPVDDFDLHTWSAAILERGDLFPAVRVDGLLHDFWGLPSRMAYTLAGSWVRWLIERYGIEKVKRASSGSASDFEEATGTSLEVAFEVWKGDLIRFYRNPRAVAAVPLRFGVKSIWTKHCARLRAAQEAEWYACLGDPFCALRPVDVAEGCAGDDGEALARAERLYAYYVTRGPVDDVAGGFAGESAAELRSRITAVLDGIGDMPQAARILWMERRADMLWHARLDAPAWVMYNAMLKLPLPGAMLRRLEIKWQATAWPDDPVSGAVLAWFTSTDDATRARIAADFHDRPIIAYLDFIDAVEKRDAARADRALYRVLTTRGSGAGRLPPRCWPEVIRRIGLLHGSI